MRERSRDREGGRGKAPERELQQCDGGRGAKAGRHTRGSSHAARPIGEPGPSDGRGRRGCDSAASVPVVAFFLGRDRRDTALVASSRRRRPAVRWPRSRAPVISGEPFRCPVGGRMAVLLAPTWRLLVSWCYLAVLCEAEPLAPSTRPHAVAIFE